ncbi:unnamed protein product [Rotaria sp. Silwood1]|nr:unnamed protein product [Rotaria sp. Silwood1]
MVNDMTDLIHKFHRLIHEKYNDTNEISPLRGMIYLDEKRLWGGLLNETENEPPGQQIDEGDVNLILLSSSVGQPERFGSGQPLNHLLANIYMFYWQQDLVKTLVNQNEIFDRYLNEMFFTWNNLKRELQSFLKRMVCQKNPHLPIAI